MQKASYSTVQLASVVLQIRNDLSFSVREYSGETVYVIEDELKSRYYRIGLAEYTFVSLLDGHRTFADALGQTASVMQDQALNESEAASFCRWLVETGLASTPESRTSARLFETAQQSQDMKIRRSANPMFLKIPLFQPDGLMKAGAAVFGWLFSWPAMCVWLVTVVAAMFCIAMNASQAASMTAGIVSRNNWLWLAVTTIALKVVHEMAHGIACRRYGGSVREAGLMTILFVPLPYVDVTSAWRLDSRWQRMMISAAGMYAELFVAALATFVWFNAEPGLLQQQAFNLMFSASVITLMFNANPLMRFDGYYMLTDVLEQPNLASHGQMLLKSIGRKTFFDLPGHSADWPEGRLWLVFVYGVAAFLWRIMICVGMVMTADAMFYGAGAVLAAIAVCMWLLIPLMKLVVFAVKGSKTETPNRFRTAWVTVVLLVAGTLIANVRWHERVQAPVVVDYDPLVEVRTAVSGFVSNVQVKTGQQVAAGTVLFELENPELDVQRQQLAIELAQSRQRGRAYHQQGEIAAWQVEVETADAIKTRLKQLDDRCETLSVVAPTDGTIVDSDLSTIIGTWVTAGTQVASIGKNGSKKLLAVVSEESLESFTKRSGQSVDVHIQGTDGKRLSGELGKPDPRGSTNIPHPAFASSAGGTLDVQVQQAGDSQDNRTTFTRPQFLTRVNLSPTVIDGLKAGRTGFVGFRADRGSVADVTTDAVSKWWSARQTALQRTWSFQ